jgi:acetyltransferase-like isoleucine patch superfamily enzyme
VPNLYRYLATSDDRLSKVLRGVYRGIRSFSLPAPALIVKPMLWIFLLIRSVYHFGIRVFICEPLFKAYCTQVGRGFRTGVYIHWVLGKGRIIIGDDVELDGKCNFQFAARFSPNPTIQIGDHTIIRGSSFVICRNITIGKHCQIAMGVTMVESHGHRSDPEERLAGLPPHPEDVRPITICDNVWIGIGSLITPGVTIGEGSIVSARSVVLSDVPPYTIVAGYPARKIASLRNPNLQTPDLLPTEVGGAKG